MADQQEEEGRLVSELFAAGILPRAPLAPPGTLGNQAWRTSLNVAPYNGVLRRRPAAVTNPVSGPSYSLTSGVEHELPLVILTGEAPGYASTFVSATCDFYTPPSATRFCALITSRRIWVFNHSSGSGAWYDCTPVYTVGTVTATNGSASITGAGTTWLDDQISGYQFITIDGTRYKICEIISNTSLTLTSNFSGGTGAGKAYSILRNWDLSKDGTLGQHCDVFATIYNGDLYVAGTYIGRADNKKMPAVIKVADVFATPVTGVYLTAAWPLSAGLDYIGALQDIAGLRCLQDGRVVIVDANSTVYYSSHLNTAVWTVTPGGNTPVSFISGSVNAVGQIGPTLTLHYENGVVLADPTGQADPPLNYRNSAATDGAFAARSLLTLGGVEYYVTGSGNVARFDGAGSVLIGNDVQHNLLRDASRATLRTIFAGYFSQWQEYQVFRMDPSSFLTKLYSYRLEDQTWWPHRIEGNLSAASVGGNPFSSHEEGAQLLGAVSVNSGGTERANLLCTFADFYLEDNVPDESAVDQGGFSVETDDLDFGLPLQYKRLKRVIVWVRAEPTTISATPTVIQDIVVSASINGGATWTDKTLTLGASIKEQPYAFWFIGDVAGADQIRVRIKTASATELKLALTRMLIEATVHGDIGMSGMIS